VNILFTNFCNKNCSYCFAKGKLDYSNPKSSYISLKNLKTVINFLKKSKQKGVGIIGGEPTLHPQFTEAVKRLLGGGFFFNVFSNGIISKSKVRFLAGIDNSKFSMLLNINTLESYSKKEWSLINNTMKALHSNISLGFTIYKTDFNPEFMLRLIKKYNLKKHIRLGIAAPIWGHNNQYLPLNAHKTVTPKIVGFAKKCDVLDVSLGFDCGFTLCSFSKQDCGELFYYNARVSAACGPVIDVSPDLRVWRCFATSMIWNRKLTDFKDLDEVYEFYNKKYRAFRRVGGADKCFKCKYLKRWQCAGGCLGHTLKSFNFEDRLNSPLLK
jgi:MoaA/NifB/PqqE/SkfB family radical SAM enzyme